MVVPEEAYRDFESIYEKEYEISLSPEEAKYKGKKLLRIFRKALFSCNYKGEEFNG